MFVVIFCIIVVGFFVGFQYIGRVFSVSFLVFFVLSFSFFIVAFSVLVFSRLSFHECFVVFSFDVSAVALFVVVSSFYSLFLLGIGVVFGLVVVFSVYYMWDSVFLHRFLFVLCLFVFSMVCFVFGVSIVVSFLGWECLGFASFWLISFHVSRVRSVFSGVKSFVVGRFGDCLFLCVVAVFLRCVVSSVLFGVFLSGLFLVAYLAFVVSFFGLFLCCSKSCVFGLHIWLPDAMEGPVPVSSLIHAATLVVSGVIFVFVHVLVLSFCCGLFEFGVFLISSVVFFVLAFFGLCDFKRLVAFGTVFVVSFGVCACFCVSSFCGLGFLAVHMHYKSALFVLFGFVFHCVSGFQDIRVLSSFSFCLVVFGLWLLFLVCSCFSSVGFVFKESACLLLVCAVVSVELVFFVVFLVCFVLVLCFSLFCVFACGFSSSSFVFLFVSSCGFVFGVFLLGFVVVFRFFEFVVLSSFCFLVFSSFGLDSWFSCFYGFVVFGSVFSVSAFLGCFCDFGVLVVSVGLVFVVFRFFWVSSFFGALFSFRLLCLLFLF